MTSSGGHPVSHIGANDADLQEGQQVGEYVVKRKIGEGGFGTVFSGEHPLIGKMVAIKVLNRQYSAQPEMVSRFVSEARAVNQIRHRNIIDIFGFGQLDDGRHYYVMEFLDGMPMDEYLEDRGQLPLEEAIPILRSVARALDAAHAKGIAHRDLKPENIFLVNDPDGIYPKLLDFGIAKLLSGDNPAEHKTRTGAPMGTPHYMSPEQCRGRDVDHRTDIYAFGIVAYLMLTAAVPFDGEDYMEILLAQISDQAAPPSTHAPHLPKSVDEGIAWMLRKDPAERPPNLVTAVRALEDAALSAGLNIPAGPAPSGVYNASTGAMARQRTPSVVTPLPNNATALGSAATVTAEQLGDTSELVEAPAQPRSKAVILGAALVGAVAVGGLVYIMVGGGKKSSSDEAKSAKQTTTQPQPQEPPAKPDPVPPTKAGHDPKPVDPPPVDPPKPQVTVKPVRVKIKVISAPAGTEVYRDGLLLGQTPGPIEIEKSDQKVELIFKKEGYVQRTYAFSPRRDGLIKVPMRRVSRHTTRRIHRTNRTNKTGKTGNGHTGRDKLEDPFAKPK